MRRLLSGSVLVAVMLLWGGCGQDSASFYAPAGEYELPVCSSGELFPLLGGDHIVPTSSDARIRYRHSSNGLKEACMQQGSARLQRG